MPTLNWIQETASDRFLENTSTSIKSQPTIYKCPYCNKLFKSNIRHDQHVSIDHPIERPILLFKGNELLHESKFHSVIQKDDIDFFNITRIQVRVDGRPPIEVNDFKLKEKLSQSQNTHIHIQVENRPYQDRMPVTSQYTISVKVASVQDLNEIDQLFIDSLARDEISMSDARHFADLTAKFTDALDYSNALFLYVTGILLKDRHPSMTLPTAEYKTRLQQAFDTLKNYDRPLAHMICAVIHLNFNEFHYSFQATGDPYFDLAHQLFATVANEPDFSLEDLRISGTVNLIKAQCPIDNESDEIIKNCARLLSTESYQALMQSLLEKTQSQTLTPDDLTKNRVLAVIAAQKCGDSIASLRLEQLADDYTFGKWASQIRSRPVETP